MEKKDITRLSVNINKIATLRNARGGDIPNVLYAATQIIDNCLADGITVHPRPDERHITYADVYDISKRLRELESKYPNIEFNIEGNPIPKFLDLVGNVHPAQVTLVPDPPDALTSNAGWNTIDNAEFLHKVVERLHAEGIRVSIFVDPDVRWVEGAKEVGADRIELYTEAYARCYEENRQLAVEPYRNAAHKARLLGLEVNAGHDLNLNNLAYFLANVPHVSEVSIGQALIADALFLGMRETIKLYKEEIYSAFNVC